VNRASAPWTRKPGGNEILMNHLAEIDPTRDHMGTLLHLASSFYGDIIVALTAELDIDVLYSNSLDLILQNVIQNSSK
jgi:hypothetical protein